MLGANRSKRSQAPRHPRLTFTMLLTKKSLQSLPVSVPAASGALLVPLDAKPPLFGSDFEHCRLLETYCGVLPQTVAVRPRCVSIRTSLRRTERSYWRNRLPIELFGRMPRSTSR